MILPMARLRILGPAERLAATVRLLQDLEVMHLAPPCDAPGCAPFAPAPAEVAERAQLVRVLADLGVAAGLLGPAPAVDAPPDPAWAADLRATLEGGMDARRALDEERLLLDRFEAIATAFGAVGQGTALRAVHLVVPAADARVVDELRDALTGKLGAGLEVLARPLPSGELAVVVLFSPTAAAEVEGLLASAHLEELAAPARYGGGGLAAALPAMRARRAEIPAELAALDAHAQRLRAAEAGRVQGALARAHDRLAALDAALHAARTTRAFVLEGWAPEAAWARLVEAVQRAFGDEVVVERVGAEAWRGRPTPVKLMNPAIFRPFELVTSLLPLPAYGTLDPTPFVAIGFPMMFGIILGDLGYAALLGAGALALWARSPAGAPSRSIAAIGLSCALFSAIFGALYGEFLGDLGRIAWGLEPLALDREEALLPALVLALGIGVVHVLLGLVLGVINAARGDPHRAFGRGLALAMMILVIVALLAVFDVLPAGVLTPAVIGLLVAFPVLVAVEGVLGPIELLGTLANVLSYARIMAVGTASVMMAVVANRLAGAFGSVLVGVLFALLFHLVNFAIGVFGPAIHVLRLHYVEFFGKFYSPGGTAFLPLRHWRPSPEFTPDGA